MKEDFNDWYESFVNEMVSSLAEYYPRNDKTGSNEKWRRFYIKDTRGKERFVVHIRPVPTKSRANVMFGLTSQYFKIQEGYPIPEVRDKSAPNYSEFNVEMKDEKVKQHSIDLAIQVAEHYA